MLLEVEENKIFFDESTLACTEPFVVVGIPAFNEASMIDQVISGSQEFADAIVVCDDGSTDLTGIIAKRLGAYVVRHRRNLGYGASIKSLFKFARKLNADVLVTIDADGQHDPKEIPNVVKPIVQNAADLVIASRFIHESGTIEMPFYRRLGAKLITMLVNGSSKNGISDAQSGFRAYSRQAIGRLNPSEKGMGASVEILLDASHYSLKILEVPSSCKYNIDKAATSTENPFMHGIDVVISIIRRVLKRAKSQ